MFHVDPKPGWHLKKQDLLPDCWARFPNPETHKGYHMHQPPHLSAVGGSNSSPCASMVQVMFAICACAFEKQGSLATSRSHGKQCKEVFLECMHIVELAPALAPLSHNASQNLATNGDQMEQQLLKNHPLCTCS